MGQLVGQFLLDRDGVVRWTFTELGDSGRHMFGAAERRRTDVGGLAARALSRVQGAEFEVAGELTGRSLSMSDRVDIGPLQPGERAPNVVLDAITREGKIAIDDFRGQKPVLVGLFRGLHCAFCRRHIAALAQLDPALREQGVESLTVVNTPIERARLYLRYHPLPLLAAADPERTSHRAFGLPNLEFTENETAWPYKVSMAQASGLQIDLPASFPVRWVRWRREKSSTRRTAMK